MFLVRAAMAPYSTSGLEQCEYSSRKWCSTVQMLWNPMRSPRIACSSVCWYARYSLSAFHGRATGIS